MDEPKTSSSRSRKRAQKSVRTKPYTKSTDQTNSDMDTVRVVPPEEDSQTKVLTVKQVYEPLPVPKLELQAVDKGKSINLTIERRLTRSRTKATKDKTQVLQVTLIPLPLTKSEPPLEPEPQPEPPPPPAIVQSIEGTDAPPIREDEGPPLAVIQTIEGTGTEPGIEEPPPPVIQGIQDEETEPIVQVRTPPPPPLSRQVQEIEVPPQGAVYERGLVWEEIQSPSRVRPTTFKGILKKNHNVSSPVPLDSDHGLRSPATKKRKASITFSVEPHHTRYFHSDPRRHKKGLPKLLRRKSIGKQNIVPAPWNPNNAIVNPPPPPPVPRKVPVTDQNRPIKTPPRPEPKVFFPVLRTPEKVNGKVNPGTFRMNLQFGTTASGSEVSTNGQAVQVDAVEEEGGSLGFEPSVPPVAAEQSNSGGLEVVAVGDVPPDVIASGQNEVLSTQDILGSERLTEEEAFVNPEAGNYNLNPVYPRLINCPDEIPSFVIKQLAQPGAQKALQKIMQSFGVDSIGSLCRRTQMDIIKWPIIPPKEETIQKVLQIYENKEHETNFEKRLVKPKTFDDLQRKPIRLNGTVQNPLIRPLPSTSASQVIPLPSTVNVNRDRDQHQQDSVTTMTTTTASATTSTKTFVDKSMSTEPEVGVSSRNDKSKDGKSEDEVIADLLVAMNNLSPAGLIKLLIELNVRTLQAQN